MGAFRRRTVFAAPLIIIAGCGGKDVGKDQLRNNPSWTVWKQAGLCRADVRLDCPKDVACNPPAPREIECPTGATEKLTVTVVEKPDKSCAIVPEGCAELACAKVSTPCPKPYGTPPTTKLAGAFWTIQRDNNSQTACLAYDALACPPMDPAPPCNPPPPRTVACPPMLGDKPQLRAAELPNGQCAIVADACKDTSCVKDKIACPLPLGQKLP